MATTVTVGSGLDYASINAAATGLETGGGHEHDFSTDGIATVSVQDSFQDTTLVTDINASNFTNGGSVSGTAYLKITVDSSNRTHKYDTAKYYLNANPNTQSGQMEISLDFTWVEHVQFVMPSSAGSSDEHIRLNSGAGDILIEKCLFHNDDGAASQDGIYAGNWALGNIYVFDCVFRSKASARCCIHGQEHSFVGHSQTWHIEHCTVDANGGDYGIGGQAGGTSVVMNVWNTYVADAGTTDFENDTGGGSNSINLVDGSRSCMSSDGTATVEFGSTGNTNNVTLKDSDTAGASYYVTSLTVNSENYQLLDGSTATDTAIDAASSGATQDSRCDTTLDIAGNSRPGTYTDRDVGAFEVAAAGGGTTPKGPLGHPLFGPLAGPVGP